MYALEKSSTETSKYMKTHQLTTTTTTTSEIIVGSGIVPIMSQIVDLHSYTKCIIITTKTVEKLHGKTLLSGLRNSIPAEILYIPDGESAKQVSVVENLYRDLVRLDVNRTTLLIAFGGGTVSDVAGFVAATFHRGLPWIAIPTTLLAQVDAAIGGKTGINFGKVKNVIGVIYQPHVVLCDTEILTTLPVREFRSGLAEVIKYAIAFDGKLLSLLESKKGNAFSNTELIDIVTRCSRIKADIVARDAQDTTGVRAILNFGHTVGHAIEAIEKGKFTHGESVSIGMIAATKLSEKTCNLSPVITQRLIALLNSFGLPTSYDGSLKTIIEKITHDKKVIGNSIGWVLLQDIGKTITNQTIDISTVKEILKGIMV